MDTHGMTPEEKAAVMQFMGQTYGHLHKSDQEIIGQSGNLKPKSNQMKQVFEQTSHIPTIHGQPHQPPPQQQNMQMLQQQQGGQPMPNRLQTLIPDGPPPGSMDIAPMDRMARGEIRTRGPNSVGAQLAISGNRVPDTFTAGFQGGQMGQVAEPNTQQLASQLQNVTQQVNQLSSHLGVNTGGPSQFQPGLQGGIGGLIQNLRPGPPPPQLRATGPVTPPMLQTTFIR